MTTFHSLHGFQWFPLCRVVERPHSHSSRWATYVGSFILYFLLSKQRRVLLLFASESSMEDVADLQLQWQRAIRLQDQVGTALLEAWASTSAANEILETLTNQGLLQETTDHPLYCLTWPGMFTACLNAPV